MAYINKNDFSIVSYVADYITAEDYFECDDLIAPAISLLNKKGYKTEYCCSGHPFGGVDAVIIEADPTQEFPDDVLIRVESSECVKNLWGEVFDIKEFPYHAVYKNVYANNLYVSFEDKYTFPDLPEGMNYEIFNDYKGSGIYQGINEYHKASDTFEGIIRIYELNKLFYEWVEKLPNLKGSK